MNWREVAAIALDRFESPMIVMGADGVVQFINQRMEQLLGGRLDALDGRLQPLVGAVQRSLQGDGVEPGRRALRAEAEVIGRGGRRLLINFAMWRIGEEGGVVLAARSWHAQEDLRRADMSYEVDGSSESWGRLWRVTRPGEAVQSFERGERCYQVLHDRTEPCEDCPGRRDPAGWSSRVVRGLSGGPALALLTAEALEPDAKRVRLTVRSVPLDALGQLVEAKATLIAREANLSNRETAVLTQLVTGHGIEEIANALEISARTVKFHQANLLEKLRASSRHELVRRVLSAGSGPS